MAVGWGFRGTFFFGRACGASSFFIWDVRVVIIIRNLLCKCRRQGIWARRVPWTPAESGLLRNASGPLRNRSPAGDGRGNPSKMIARARAAFRPVRSTVRVAKTDEPLPPFPQASEADARKFWRIV